MKKFPDLFFLFWCHWSPWEFSHCFKEEVLLALWIACYSCIVTYKNIQTRTPLVVLPQGLNNPEDRLVMQKNIFLSSLSFLWSMPASMKSREWFVKQKYTVVFAFSFSLIVKAKAKYETLFFFMKLLLQKRIRRPIKTQKLYTDICIT